MRILGESHDSGYNPGLDALAITSRQEGFAMHFGYEAPDSKTGLIMGDFLFGRILDHEGRGAGKKEPPGVEKSMLFSEAKESSGNKLVVN